MGRPTQKFVTANKDKLEKISEEHKYLIEDFLIYCKAEGKSPKTIINYRSDLNIFFCCGDRCIWLRVFFFFFFFFKGHVDM